MLHPGPDGVKRQPTPGFACAHGVSYNVRMVIRTATVADVPDLCHLINSYAEQGQMLHRSMESLYDSLREFTVARDDRGLAGCIAVDLFWSDLAEVKSMAVRDDCRGQGLGGKLLAEAIADARRFGVKRLFALTYQQRFFEKHGFVVIDRQQLPEKVWRECLVCPKVDACDEIAMMLYLDRTEGR